MEIGGLHVIETSEGRVFSCECGHVLCAVAENFKAHVLKRDRPLRDMQPARLSVRASNQFILREYICSKCGVLFEVDVVQKDKPEDVLTMKLK